MWDSTIVLPLRFKITFVLTFKFRMYSSSSSGWNNSTWHEPDDTWLSQGWKWQDWRRYDDSNWSMKPWGGCPGHTDERPGRELIQSADSGSCNDSAVTSWIRSTDSGSCVAPVATQRTDSGARGGPEVPPWGTDWGHLPLWEPNDPPRDAGQNYMHKLMQDFRSKCPDEKKQLRGPRWEMAALTAIANAAGKWPEKHIQLQRLISASSEVIVTDLGIRRFREPEKQKRLLNLQNPLEHYRCDFEATLTFQGTLSQEGTDTGPALILPQVVHVRFHADPRGALSSDLPS